MRILGINSSPRRDGNSALLIEAAADGARAAGHDANTIFLGDWVSGVLDDCQTCRRPDGTCAIPDRYTDLLTEHLMPADGWLIAAPLHYYGMPSRLKALFDRVFCHTSSAAPAADAVLESTPGKRLGLLITAEETYPSASFGLIHQMQEIARYQRQHLVGVVHAYGNRRGEVAHDPGEPLKRARHLGRRLFDLPVSDYQFDTPRASSVWSPGG